MPTFDFIALTAEHKEARGTIDAPSVSEASSRLRADGFFPTTISEQKKAPRFRLYYFFGRLTPSERNGIIAAVVGLTFILFYMKYLGWSFSEGEFVSSSPKGSSASSLSASHDQREADTKAGFNLGRSIGAKRAREGFPKPSLAYLDSIIQATIPNESEAYKLGFKTGYVDGWEKRDGSPL